jgi:signal transduction histidine kinase
MNNTKIVDHGGMWFDFINKNLVISIFRNGSKRMEEKGSNAVSRELHLGNSDLSFLLKITLDLLETVEKRKVLQKIIEGAVHLVGLDTGALYLVEDENLILEVTSPPLPEDHPAEFRKASIENHHHILETVKTKLPVIVDDIDTEFLSNGEKVILQNRNMRSLLYIPLMVMQKVKGVMILATVGRKYNFSKREIDLCYTLSNIGSLSLENSVLFENLTIAKEKAEESDRLKTAFLHNISHEIRTPLNSIVGFSTFLSDQDLTPEKRKIYSDIIISSNDQLLYVIDEIIRISHLEAGQVTVTKSVMDVRRVMTSLFNQFQPMADRKQLGFNLDMENVQEGTVMNTDEGKLRQILSNLLDNAFKFTHEGFVRFEGNKKGEDIEFVITDTGIGIAENEHGRIFERFYQVKKFKADIYGGTGLGLSICAGYAGLLGGSLKVASSYGKGSVFTLSLPV